MDVFFEDFLKEYLEGFLEEFLHKLVEQSTIYVGISLAIPPVIPMMSDDCPLIPCKFPENALRVKQKLEFKYLRE